MKYKLKELDRGLQIIFADNRKYHIIENNYL